MKFTNWETPSVKQLLKEYQTEQELKGNKFWQSKRDFVDAVRDGKIEKITPKTDASIGYRSRTRNKEELLCLIKNYQSYPEFRNEDTLDAIYSGYAKNEPMDRPIVIEFGNGKRRVFSGNTRMDAAFHLGVLPEVLIVKPNSSSQNAAQPTKPTNT